MGFFSFLAQDCTVMVLCLPVLCTGTVLLLLVPGNSTEVLLRDPYQYSSRMNSEHQRLLVQYQSLQSFYIPDRKKHRYECRVYSSRILVDQSHQRETRAINVGYE